MRRPSKTSPAETSLRALQASIDDVKPYMFTLADQLLAACPDRKWNIIIGDDIGGRLPTHFLHTVLKRAGYPLPVWFIAASKRHRDSFGEDAYDSYLATRQEQLGITAIRALLTTESTSRGGTIQYISDRVTSLKGDVETAALVNRYPKYMTTTYAASAGRRAAYHVFKAFEAPGSGLGGTVANSIRAIVPDTITQNIPASIRKAAEADHNPLLGLRVEGALSTLPVARRFMQSPAAHQAYALMDILAAEYLQDHELLPQAVSEVIPD